MVTRHLWSTEETNAICIVMLQQYIQIQRAFLETNMRGDELSWIHDVVGIQSSFYPFHRLQSLYSKFLFKVLKCKGYNQNIFRNATETKKIKIQQIKQTGLILTPQEGFLQLETPALVLSSLFIFCFGFFTFGFHFSPSSMLFWMQSNPNSQGRVC